MDPGSLANAPGVVPTQFQSLPGLTTVAAGEPVPGVFVDLLLEKTTYVAGGVFQPAVRVRNTTGAEVWISESQWAVADGQDPASQRAQTAPRSFPNFIHGPPGIGGPHVPAGQTWAIPSTIVQLPFDAQPPVHLHSALVLSTPQAQQPGFGPGRQVFADIPVRLTAATSAQELHLELHADRRQWCLRATDAQGGVPVGPLFVNMTARTASASMDGGVAARGSGGTWAEPWPQNTVPNDSSITLAVWVGGPNYVTARADTTVP